MLADENQYQRVWYAAEAASPLGCSYQLQLCFASLPSSKNCTPLSSTMDLMDELLALGADQAIFQRQKWLIGAASNLEPSVVNIVRTQAEAMLGSRQRMEDGKQELVPPDQWQQDVLRWYDTSQVGIQQSLLVTTAGDLPDAPSLIRGPENDEERKLCSSMKIVSANHVSFSVFGIAFIAAFGVITLIVSWVLEPVTYWVRERLLHRGKYARLEWYSHGFLQLQRLGQEELGMGGSWMRCDETVPTNKDNAMLAGLDISDEAHPLLSRRPTTQESETKTKPESSTRLAPSLHEHSTEEGRSSSQTVAAAPSSAGGNTMTLHDGETVTPGPSIPAGIPTSPDSPLASQTPPRNNHGPERRTQSQRHGRTSTTIHEHTTPSTQTGLDFMPTGQGQEGNFIITATQTGPRSLSW